MQVHRNGAVRFRKTRRRPQPVQVIKVDPRILKTALRLAKGDASKLRSISATKIEVRP